jgi:hypothetical protein
MTDAVEPRLVKTARDLLEWTKQNVEPERAEKIISRLMTLQASSSDERDVA